MIKKSAQNSAETNCLIVAFPFRARLYRDGEARLNRRLSIGSLQAHGLIKFSKYFVEFITNKLSSPQIS